MLGAELDPRARFQFEWRVQVRQLAPTRRINRLVNNLRTSFIVEYIMLYRHFYGISGI